MGLKITPLENDEQSDYRQSMTISLFIKLQAGLEIDDVIFVTASISLKKGEVGISQD
jgi:hypothetical protein